MYRQFNSPMEMLRRVAYLAYLASVFVFIIGIVAVFGRPAWDVLAWVGGAFVLAAVLRQVGYRRLDFERMVVSFPEGCARDAVPEPVRNEVEGLVSEFQSPDTNWIRRTEIRHRLVELEDCQPEIIEAYADELHDVLAA